MLFAGLFQTVYNERRKGVELMDKVAEYKVLIYKEASDRFYEGAGTATGGILSAKPGIGAGMLTYLYGNKKIPALAVGMGTVAGSAITGNRIGKLIDDRREKKRLESELAKVSEYKAAIFEKAANDMGDAIEKGFSQLKSEDGAEDVLRSVKIKNMKKPADTFRERVKEPENFRYKGKVKADFYPTFDNNEVGYESSASGMGRKNQFIEGTRSYHDIPSFYKKDETDSEYNARRDKNVRNAVGHTSRGKKLGNIANLAGLGTGLLGGAMVSRNIRDPAVRMIPMGLGAVGGAAAGVVPNVILRARGQQKTNKAYIESLQPREREILMGVKKKDAATMSQDIRNSHRAKATNYYMV